MDKVKIKKFAYGFFVTLALCAAFGAFAFALAMLLMAASYIFGDYAVIVMVVLVICFTGGVMNVQSRSK